jgi:hypothetical protein
MRFLRPAFLALVAVGAACGRAVVEPEPFHVVRVAPDLGGTQPLALNDSITVCFSADLAPLSVTADSCSVVDERGLRVAGTLRVRGSHLTFQPRPPLAPDLRDGSFVPGHLYRLILAGLPRPDAVRAADGRRLAAGMVREFRMASLGDAGAQVLHSPVPGLPFFLVAPEGPQRLPVDAPWLRLRFTAPVAPWSVALPAVQVRRYGNPVETLQPRGLRLAEAGRDEMAGTLLEVDLGGPLLDGKGQPVRPLRTGDLLSVALVSGASALRDYTGAPVFAAVEPCWSVVPGSLIARVEWPSTDAEVLAEDGILPGFECHGGLLVPMARVETGAATHGLFRPQRDTWITPGQPFDRGDGVQVVSAAGRFEFLAVDVPEGVVVTLDATQGPIRLLAAGGIRIAGTLRILGSASPLRRLRPGSHVEGALEQAPVAMAAAGTLAVAGRIEASPGVGPEATVLCLASATGIELTGEVPFNSLLAVASPEGGGAGPAIRGARGQTVVAAVSFTRGVPAGGRWSASCCSPWLQLPSDTLEPHLAVFDATPGCTVAWQVAPADPLQPRQPDLRPGRPSGMRLAQDRDRLAMQPGEFVRFRVAAEVAWGMPVGGVRGIQIADR